MASKSLHSIQKIHQIDFLLQNCQAATSFHMQVACAICPLCISNKKVKCTIVLTCCLLSCIAGDQLINSKTTIIIFLYFEHYCTSHIPTNKSIICSEHILVFWKFSFQFLFKVFSSVFFINFYLFVTRQDAVMIPRWMTVS